jgi:hypothetical protein
MPLDGVHTPSPGARGCPSRHRGACAFLRRQRASWPAQRDARRSAAPGGESLRARFSVIVEPDAFYVRFFDTLLRQGARRGEAQIREALDAARLLPFTVFERELRLTTTAPAAPARPAPGSRATGE